MAVVRYHRYTGELWDELDLESLVDELSDFFLQSGFGEEEGEWDEDALQALHDAILDAVLKRGLLSPQDLERVMADQDALDELLQKTVERLMREGYLRASEAQPFHDPTGGDEGRPGPPIRFELTEKSVDFLGYRALRDLLGLGRQGLLRPPRHARPGDRGRGLGPLQAVGVRGHDEPRRLGDAAVGVRARGPEAPARRGLRRPPRAPEPSTSRRARRW